MPINRAFQRIVEMAGANGRFSASKSTFLYQQDDVFLGAKRRFAKSAKIM